MIYQQSIFQNAVSNTVESISKDLENTKTLAGQEPDWSVPDRTARGILQKHGLKVSDLKTLDNDGVLVTDANDDIPGGIVDDRCLHISTHLVAVQHHIPNVLDRCW